MKIQINTINAFELIVRPVQVVAKCTRNSVGQNLYFVIYLSKVF